MRYGEYSDNETLIQLHQGKPFWLNHADAMWQLQEGKVEVFALTADTAPRYQQIFLFEAVEGDILFGLPANDGQETVRLMILPVVDSVFIAKNLADIAEQNKEERRAYLQEIWGKIENWLGLLLSSVKNVPSPRSARFLPEGEVIKLLPTETVTMSESLVWVQVLSGKIKYESGVDYNPVENEHVPLAGPLWLLCIEEAVLQGAATCEVFSAEQFVDSDTFWQPLRLCHHFFNEIMLQYFSAEDKRSGEQLALRRQRHEQLLYGASAHLLSSDLPDLALSAAATDVYSPLLTVVRMIAAQLGVYQRQVKLPLGLDPLRQDVSALRNITRLAGMQVRLVSLQKDWHRRDNGPLLGYYGIDKHPVALLLAAPGRYRMYDPINEIWTNVEDAIASDIGQDAFVFYTGIMEETVTLVKWLKFMLNKCWSGDLRTIVLTCLAAGLIPILTPFVTQVIFDDIIPINDRQSHVMVIQVMMIAALASAGVAFTRSMAFIRIKSKSRFNAEAALWLRLLSLPTSFFRQYQAGDLVQRMTGVSQISTLLSSASVSTIFNTVFSFWSLLLMTYYSWKLTMIACTVWLAYFLVFGLVVWQIVACKRKMTVATGNTAGQVLQIFNGLSKFRMQGAESQAFHMWAKQFGEEWKWNRATRWKSNYLDLVNVVQSVLMTMLIFYFTMDWFTASQQNNTTFMSQPEFLAFNAALTGLNAAVIGMVPVIVGLLDLVPLIERLQPILQAKPEVTEDKIEAGELSGHIDVTNISFRYQAETPLILRNISMTIRAGSFVAVVGGSGSGKSTLLRLLLGFEKAENGSIYFDGKDLAELNITSVRSQMGVVLQNGQLTSGSIFDNIVGSLPLTLEDAWLAAEMVGLADDIRAMPMGMHTIISEGANNISGGQRQRILIARSIVNRPRILIFDEATSALDNQTQAIVTESMAKLKATRIVVAHRLSTIINADMICVMDKGQLVEQGTYYELMAANGLFAALARRQLA